MKTRTYLRKTSQDDMWGSIEERIQYLISILPPKKSVKQKKINNASGGELTISKISRYFQEHNARVVIIGTTKLEKIVIENVLRSIGIPGDRVIYHLDYLYFKKKSIESIYSLDTKDMFIVGPIPHSNKGVYNIFEYLTQLLGNEHVAQALTASGELKLTKESIKQALLLLFEQTTFSP